METRCEKGQMKLSTAIKTVSCVYLSLKKNLKNLSKAEEKAQQCVKCSSRVPKCASRPLPAHHS